jgi:hypothetical protein
MKSDDYNIYVCVCERYMKSTDDYNIYVSLKGCLVFKSIRDSFKKIYIYIIRNINEAKQPVSSLGLGSIKSGLCATCLLNKPFGETKLYLIIEHTYSYKI